MVLGVAGLPGTLPTDRYCPIPLVPFRGVNCSDAAGSEMGVLDILRLGNVTATGFDSNMGES